MFEFILNTFFNKVKTSKEKVTVKAISDSPFISLKKEEQIKREIKKAREEKTSLDKYFCDFKGLFEFKSGAVYFPQEWKRSHGLRHEREIYRNSALI